LKLQWLLKKQHGEEGVPSASTIGRLLRDWGWSRSRGTAADSPRTGAKRTVVYYMRQRPAYLRLLGGLLTDKRGNLVEKLLVAGAMA